MASVKIINAYHCRSDDKNKRPIHERGLYFGDKDEIIYVGIDRFNTKQYYLYEDNKIIYSTDKDYTDVLTRLNTTVEENLKNYKDFKSFKNCYLKIPNYIDTLGFDLINKLKRRGIFIGGCGRSGTTLLTSILGAHSSVHSIPNEKHCFSGLYLPRKLYYEIESTHSLFYVEKTPKNVLEFKTIDYYIHNSKFIHIVRDCRDVITSHHPTNKKKYWVSVDRWYNDVKQGLQFKNPLVIRYEDLIQNFEPTMTKICDYLGLAWEDNFNEYYKYTNLRTNIAWTGEATQITNKSIGRWKQDKYKSRIKEVYKNKEVLNLLDTLGYEV